VCAAGAAVLLTLAPAVQAGNAEGGSSAAAAAAALPTARPYFLQSYTWQFADTSRRAQSGRGALLGAGLPLSEHFNIELSGYYTTFNPDPHPPAAAWRDYGGRVDGMFMYSRDPAFSPYFDFGAGYGHHTLKDTGEGSSGPTLETGFGVMHYFSAFGEALALRGDARYRWSFVDGDHYAAMPVRNVLGEPVVTVGLVVPFGSAQFSGTSQ
jgi:OOP family OmpA-OmpF porin